MEKALLCQHIVHTTFGPNVGRIATLLLEKGRLTLPELLRLSSRTCSSEGHVLLSPHFIRSALALLIQHNIVWFHWTLTNEAIHVRARDEEFQIRDMATNVIVPEGSDRYAGALYYEINPDEIVTRLRFPQFLVMAEKLAEGGSGKGLLELVLAHGKIAIGDLLSTYAKNDPNKREEAYNVLDWMLKHSYFVPVTKSSRSKYADRYLERERVNLDPINTGPTTAKYKGAQKKAFDQARDNQEEEMNNARRIMFDGPPVASDVSSFRPSSTKTGSKRKMHLDDQAPGPRKRRTYNSSLQESTIIKVNNNRFLLKIRNKLIEDAFRNYYGKAAELVIRAALALIEEKVEGDPNEIDLEAPFSAPFSTQQVLERMSSICANNPVSKKNLQDILRDAFTKENVQSRSYSRYASNENIVWEPAKENTSSFVRELLGRLSCADEDPLDRGKATPCWVRPNILTVTRNVEEGEDEDDTHKFNYLHQGTDGSEKWVIDYHKTQLDLKRQLAYGIIKDKFWNQANVDRETGQTSQNEKPGRAGKEAVRIMRILDAHGKLEEKHIFKLAMISQKDCRKWIFDLARYHFVQQQEIPKTTDRAIARTYFLWYVDWTKTNNTLEKMLYQSLGNIETRKAQESAPLASLVAKSRRQEVVDDPSHLRDDEWASLSDLQRKLVDLEVGQWRIMADLLILQLRDRETNLYI